MQTNQCIIPFNDSADRDYDEECVICWLYD